MVRLSVNVNKVATLRNARGGDVPNVLQAALTCVRAGAQGITVHPRLDQRHIRPSDVLELASALTVELNIEGDPRPDFMDLVLQVKPGQCTLVPVSPGEITSDHGWDLQAHGLEVKQAIQKLKTAGIRVSIFMDADPGRMDMAREVGADRVELYTAPYAAAIGPEAREAEYRKLDLTAKTATSLGMGVNAGHDLNLDNLTMFRDLPGLLEVSIGHHLIAHALDVGLTRAVQDYLEALKP